MKHDPLSDALVLIKNADHVGKESAVVPASRLIGDVLKLLTEKGYLNNYEFRENGRGGEFDISLNGRINGCGAIKPRFSIKLRDVSDSEYVPLLYLKSIASEISSSDNPICCNTCSEGMSEGRTSVGFILDGKNLKYVLFCAKEDILNI